MRHDMDHYADDLAALTAHLALSNQWKNTALWELSGVEGKVDVGPSLLSADGPAPGAPERQEPEKETSAPP